MGTHRIGTALLPWMTKRVNGLAFFKFMAQACFMKSKARVWCMSVANALMLIGPCGHLLVAAAGDENWDAQFGVPGVTGGGLEAMLVDGSALFVGGHFFSVGGVQATNVASLGNAEWRALGQGVNGSGFPNALSMSQFAGSLFVGGNFSEAGEGSANSMAAWDGTNWSTL